MSQSWPLREIKFHEPPRGDGGRKCADAGWPIQHPAEVARLLRPFSNGGRHPWFCSPYLFPLPESHHYNASLSNGNSLPKCPSSSPTKTCRTPGCADTRTNTCSRSRPPAHPRLNCGAPRISRISTRPIQPPARVSYGRNPWLGITLTIKRKPTNIALYELWAPELHVVDNNWYVYFAADIPPLFNAKHQMYVLKGPAATVDPMLETSAFNLVGTGPIANLPDRWAIDGTMIHLNNQWYLVYSGWPQGANNELKQELWISKMKSPTEADPAHPAASISSPTDHAWEAHTDSGGLHQINEGPAWLEIGSFRGIIFSASASWSSDYTLGVLQYVGGDPLQKSSWHKSHQQLLRDNPNGKGPWGPGHCSYAALANYGSHEM